MSTRARTALAAATLALLAGCAWPASATTHPSTAAPAASPSATGKSAAAALAALPVKGRAPMTGYSRDQFGPSWKDVDGNGCDTRNDVLARDLVERVMEGRCTVLSGVLYPDPYTATKIVFTRGRSTIDIDHVVALGNAWATGAQQIGATARTSLANDPLNLLAVDYSANRQKADADAATWLPANKAYRCSYVARQIAVKTKYRLWVTPAEKDAMSRVLSTCPSQALPTNTTLPTPVPVSEPAPKPASSSTPEGGAAVRYPTCADARAAGVAPILKSASPDVYAANTHLDRDGDGRACT